MKHCVSGRVAAVLAVAAFAVPLAAGAQVPLDGYFIARAACPATQNIRAGDNPGGVVTEIDRAYDLVGKNKAAATHYWIVTAGPEPLRRWVPVSCGERVVPVAGSGVVGGLGTGSGDSVPAGAGGNGAGGNGAGGPSSSGAASGSATPAGSGGSGQPAFHILAVSWQPAFCETHRDKAECASQTAERFDADHFSLHGLWPAGQYCGIAPDVRRDDEAGRWDDLPALQLSADTRARLETVMPGTQSRLDRHEWVKHGSCFGDGSPEGYYRASLALMEALNASPARDFFAERIGREVTGADIRAAFDAAFGPGAGERVKIDCADGLVVELTIGLFGEIGPQPDIAELIHAARPTGQDCARGVIDPAGFQ